MTRTIPPRSLALSPANGSLFLQLQEKLEREMGLPLQREQVLSIALSRTIGASPLNPEESTRKNGE